MIFNSHADFWTMKWSDVLRSSRKTLDLKGVQAYHKWLRHKISENVPFDNVIYELLTADGNPATNPPANYYRATRDPTALAEIDRPALLRHPHAMRQVPQSSL